MSGGCLERLLNPWRVVSESPCLCFTCNAAARVVMPRVQNPISSTYPTEGGGEQSIKGKSWDVCPFCDADSEKWMGGDSLCEGPVVGRRRLRNLFYEGILSVTDRPTREFTNQPRLLTSSLVPPASIFWNVIPTPSMTASSTAQPIAPFLAAL